MSKLSRRNFMVGSGCAVLAPTIIPAAARGADGHVAPSNRITLGVMGRGAMGRGHTTHLSYKKGVQLLAICDPDKTRAQEGVEAVTAVYAQARGKEDVSCAAYTDYREVLARQDLDAVLIATPDHWHTPMAIHAVQAGKDVYLEKPVSLSLQQGRQLVTAVRAHKRVLQTGTQYRAIQVMHEAINFVRAGGLGKVKKVFTLWDWLGMPDGTRSRVPEKALLAGEPIPEGLDWEMWLGPAPQRPYNHAYHRNPIPGVVPWSFCEDFSLGCSTLYHSHAADVIQYALGVEESGPLKIIHPADGEYPTLTCQYAQGTLLHHVDNWRAMKEHYPDLPAEARIEGNFGGVFVGERGWLSILHGGGKLEASSPEFFKEMQIENPLVTGANNHHDLWLEAIKTRQKPSAHEEIGHRSAALGQLVAGAYKLGRSLRWDPVKELFEGDDEANRLKAITLRAPWQV